MRNMIGLSLAIALAVFALNALAVEPKPGDVLVPSSASRSTYLVVYRRGVFRFELQRWKPNPWEEISRERAARGG